MKFSLENTDIFDFELSGKVRQYITEASENKKELLNKLEKRVEFLEKKYEIDTKNSDKFK